MFLSLHLYFEALFVNFTLSDIGMNKTIENIQSAEIQIDLAKSSGLFVDKNFIFTKGVKDNINSLVRINQPYNTDTGRIMHIMEGDAIYTINLVEYHIQKGDLIVIPPESIVEVNSHTDSYILQAVTLPDSANIENDCLHFSLNAKDEELTASYFDFIWQVISSLGYHPHIIAPLVDSLYHNIMFMFNQHVASEANKTVSRKDMLMKRFFMLVKQHSIYERSIDFYAKELFVSSCYLSIIVKQESGHSVMFWVNRSLIYRAKVALHYSNKNITEIADELNFSNTSFFCKFFKNATGFTPSQYRHSLS